jgi:hypothetical protein
MYPNSQELVALNAAEKLMAETMARYDPSHDAYHGQYFHLNYCTRRKSTYSPAYATTSPTRSTNGTIHREKYF